MINPIKISTPFVIGDNSSGGVVFPTSGSFSARITGRNEDNSFLFEILSSNITFNATLPHEASMGDVLDFEVNSSKNDKQLILKLLTKKHSSKHSSMNQMNQLSSSDIKELFEQSGFTQEIDIREGYIDSGQLEKDRELAALKRSINNDQSVLTTALVNQLLASGVNMSDIDVTELKNEAYNLAPTFYYPTGNVSFDIEGALKSHNLSKENASILQKAYNYYEKVVENSKPQEIVAVLSQKLPLTLGNLHNAVVSLPYYKQNELTDFDKLEQQIKNLYKDQDIVVNSESLEQGKLLYSMGAEITKENINILNNVPKTYYYYVLDQACICIKENKKITDIELGGYHSKEIYDNYKVALQNVDNVSFVDNVNNVNNSNNYDIVDNVNNVSLSKTIELEDIVYKKNLAQIQLKLTTQAAYQLAATGIDINTKPIQEALDELIKVEARLYENLAIKKGISIEEIEPIKDNLVKLYDSIKNITPFQPQAFKYVVDNYENFNVDSVDKVTTSAKLAAGYDAHMTVPNAKYGDSFTQVYNQLNTVVTGVGLADTEENIRLASILSRAGIDINIDSMLQAKVIHKKLDYVVDNLHPAVALDMIKDGINPLTTHIDDMINYIDNHEQAGMSKKLAEHIADISDKLDSDERSKVMAVYRALHQVNSQGAASLGINMQVGSDLTLGHLLDAAQYYKKTGAKYTYIDTNTNEADSVKKPSDTNIRNILADISLDISLKEATTKLTSDIIAKADTSLPLSTIYDNLSTVDNVDNVQKQQEDLENTLYEIKKTVENIGAINLLKNNNEKSTIQNVNSLLAIVEKPSQLKTKFEKISEQIDINDIPEEPIKYLSEQTFEDVSKALEKAKDLQTIEYKEIDLKDISILQNSLRLQKNLPLNSYSIPIKIGGVASMLQMSVRGSISNSTSILFALDTPAFGQVNALMQTTGNHINIFANINNQILNDAITSNISLLTKNFDDIGFFIENVITNEQITDKINNETGSNFTETTTDGLTREGIFKLATAFTNFLNAIH